MKFQLSKRIVSLSAMLCLVAGAAAPELFVFSGRKDGQSIRLEARSTRVGDVDYVSLPTLIEGLGGVVDIGPARVRIELYETISWVEYGGERVFTDATIYLEHPILRADNDALIAVEDVTDLFAKAYQLNLDQSTGKERRPSKSYFRGGRTEIVDPDGSRLTRRRTLRPVRPRASARSQIESIIIDPGHGGFDKGLVGNGGLQEKDIALTVGLALRDALSARVKPNVILTREGDSSLTLKERTRRAAEHPGGILISIHAAGSFSPLAHGVAIYYGSPSSRRGARAESQATDRLRSRQGTRAVDQSPIIAQHVAEALEAATGIPPRSVGEAPIRLLDSLGIYGLHIEVGCLTNPEEESLLKTDEHIQTLASAIADGLASYLGESAEELVLLEPSSDLLP